MVVVQDGKFSFTNPALLQQLDHSEEEILGRDFLPLVLGELVPSKTDFRVLHKYGKPIWLQISTPVVDWNGSPATLTFMSDITERQQAEDVTRGALAKQQELNEVRNRFVAMTSHEFCTPLATI